MDLFYSPQVSCFSNVSEFFGLYGRALYNAGWIQSRLSIKSHNHLLVSHKYRPNCIQIKWKIHLDCIGVTTLVNVHRICKKDVGGDNL